MREEHDYRYLKTSSAHKNVDTLQLLHTKRGNDIQKALLGIDRPHQSQPDTLFDATLAFGGGHAETH